MFGILVFAGVYTHKEITITVSEKKTLSNVAKSKRLTTFSASFSSKNTQIGFSKNEHAEKSKIMKIGSLVLTEKEFTLS